jgi:lipid-binding SYLF domain-containing protein
MRWSLVPLVALTVFAMPSILRADTAEERLASAAEVLEIVLQQPDRAIPLDLLKKAECIVIVPSLKRGAFIVGGEYGRGVAVCRQRDRGRWSAPAGIRIEGGNVGFQIGGSETEVVMLVMNEKGVRRLLSSQFTLGGDASVAAGPVGRTTTAKTDASMTAEILSWSRSRGIFAGVALSGSTLREDAGANEELYGSAWPNREILTGAVQAPEAAQRLLAILERY